MRYLNIYILVVGSEWAKGRRALILIIVGRAGSQEEEQEEQEEKEEEKEELKDEDKGRAILFACCLCNVCFFVSSLSVLFLKLSACLSSCVLRDLTLLLLHLTRKSKLAFLSAYPVRFRKLAGPFRTGPGCCTDQQCCIKL